MQKSLSLLLILTLTLLAFAKEAKQSKLSKEKSKVEAVKDSTDEEKEFLASFLVGNYVAIGKFPDTDSTYTLTISVAIEKGKLEVKRQYRENEIICNAYIGNALAGDVKVLRVSWSEKGKEYETTFLIDGDLDNYARLTGYLYEKKGSTKKVGLEAWFCNFGQLIRE